MMQIKNLILPLFFLFFCGNNLSAQITYTTNPAVGVFQNCPTSTFNSFCPVNPTTYNGNTLRMKVVSVNGATVVFQVGKCDWSAFSSNGTLFVKEGGVCGAFIEPSYGVQSGTSGIQFSLDFGHTSGTREIWAVFEAGDGGRYYAGPIDVTATNNQPSPSITLTEPDGGENFIAGSSSMQIQWNYTNIGSNVSIELYNPSTNDIDYVIANPTNNDGSHYWAIPASVNSGTYRIKIYETGTGNGVDYSGDITIGSNASITVTDPNDGDVFVAGSSYIPIRWYHTGIGGNVVIEITDANEDPIEALIEPTANDGSYNWTVPATYPPGDYKIKIYEFGTNNAPAHSETFTINSGASITLNHPDDNNSFSAGSSTMQIRWTSLGLGAASVSIELTDIANAFAYL